MTKQLRLFFTMLLLAIVGNVSAQEVVYDFTGTDWKAENGTLSNGTVSITGEGSGSFKMNSGYFMLGKSGAYITLPAYDFAVEKIEVVGRSGASGSCKQNIFVGETAVSTETTGVTGSNIYEIASDYQDAGTQYTIKVTSAHNSQITAIKIYKAGGTVVETVAAPTFSPEGGIFTEEQSVEINSTTDGATIYYTTDGSTPSDESEEYTGAITVSETTTIKAIAVKDGMNNSAVATATYTIKTVDPNWIDFTVQGYENAEDVTTVSGTNGSVTFAIASGKNAPKWYDSGSAVRIYTNNTITITAEDGKKIESVEFSITSGSMTADGFDVDGTYASSIFTLAAPTNTIVYTTSTNFRLDKIKINLSSDTREEAGLAFSAGEYTATLGGQNEFPTLSNPNGLTVSYESTNENVATVDATGVVTINAAGETTITATSEETTEFMAGSASYTLTVTDPNAPGSENNPYTVEQANAAIDANTGMTNVYVKGIVSQIGEVSTEYGNATYWISDDGTTSGQLEVYRGKYIGNERFTSADQIQIGDEVVVYGTLVDFKGTHEFTTNNYLVSLERPAQPKYYVVGYHNSWDNGEAVTDNLEMKRAEDGTLKVTVALGGTSTTGDFKIIKVEEGVTTAWYGATADGSYWITADNHTDIPLVDQAANLHIETAGTYDFSLNVDDLTLTVTGWPEPKWYLAGSFATTDAWADDMAEFESQGNGIYTLIKELEANTELKVVNEGVDQWYSTNPAELTKENSSQGIQLSTDNGSNMKIAPAGTYTFTLDANTMTLSVTGWQIVLEGNFFVKVTSADELEDGAYLIVCEDATEAGGDDAVLNGNIETIDSGSNFISVVSTNNTLIPATDDNKKAVFIISNGTIQSASQGYYIGATSNSNQIVTSTTEAYGNNISIDEDGNAIITADFDGSDRTLGFFDQNGGRFRYYGPKSNATAVQLYKLTTIEPVTVKLNKYGYATMYYGNLALTVPEGVTATTYTEDVEESTTYNAGDAIPAGEAVVLKGEANTEYTFELTTTDVDPNPNNALMGLDEAGTTVAPADGDYKFYMLSAKNGKVGFYYGTGCPNGEAFQTAAHKAYLAVSVAAGAKECYIFGETTGINNIQNAEFAEGSVYNLNGQRVDKSYKGVVIVNGKKLIKK